MQFDIILRILQKHVVRCEFLQRHSIYPPSHYHPANDQIKFYHTTKSCWVVLRF